MRTLYKDAVVAFKGGDYALAYQGFLKVWEIEKKPKVAGNLGRAELKVGKYCGAVEHLRLFLDAEKDLPAEDRSALEQLVSEARAKTSTLQLAASPSGAEVFLDGTSAGVAPLGRELCLDPGEHTVELRRGGSVTKSSIAASPGAKLAERMTLPPAPPVPPRVPARAPVKAGEPPTMRTAVLVGGGGLALAGIGVGVGLLVASELKVSDVRASLAGFPGKPGDGSAIRCTNHIKTCTENVRVLAESDVLANGGSIALGFGAAMGVAMIGSWWFTRTRARSGTQLMPMVADNHGGVLLVGTW